jgi:hypothetical protein
MCRLTRSENEISSELRKVSDLGYIRDILESLLFTVASVSTGNKRVGSHNDGVHDCSGHAWDITPAWLIPCGSLYVGDKSEGTMELASRFRIYFVWELIAALYIRVRLIYMK